MLNKLTGRKANGFTLLEVLVAVLIMAIGLLGLSAMNLRSLAFNQSASLRNQAVILAYDMMDRMRANKPAAEANAYNRSLDDPAPTTPANIYETDVAQWLANLGNVLPEGAGAIACNGDACLVTVEWNDANAAAKAGENDEEGNVLENRQVTVGARL